MQYELHKLTGSDLLDADGCATGPESAGVISRHKTPEAAERAAARWRDGHPLGPRVEVRVRIG